MKINEAFDIMHGEERRMEIENVKAAQRDEKIGQLTKEYFNNTGTFLEWIQGIEIGEDSELFGMMHKETIDNSYWSLGIDIKILFWTYCEEKAIEEVNDNE